MGDTFNEFVQFISDDPIMLALCVAVVALIIVFFIVLCAGGKKKEKEEKENVIENTTQLFANDVSEEPLKSTQQLNLADISSDISNNLINEEEKLNVTNKIAVIDNIVDDLTEKEAPISIDEAINLKTNREINDIKDTVPIPIMKEDVINPVDISLPKDQQLLEERVDELSILPDNVGIASTLNSSLKDEYPTQPFSSVYLKDGQALPINTSDFSRTNIIKHVPTMEETVVKSESVDEIPVVIEEDLNDIELPKLSSSNDNPTVSGFADEWFNIN